MNTHPEEGLCLAVLIPHRDSRRLLQQWSVELFAAGLQGAWSFPWAAPLCIISRFLTKDELNDLAHALREASLAGGQDGKITARDAAALPFPAVKAADACTDLSLYGPALDLKLPEPLFAGSAAAALVHAFPSPVLASAIIDDVPLLSSPPPPPVISFRAAAAANMIYRPRPCGGSYSFEWQIGELHWLPSVRKKRGVNKWIP
ncbi:hypothetical protein FACS189491_11020 [Spirochaetia bacterium]|nr:hypothetical protein FACS189491_11020 [Spirochaetia bacterium]